MRDGQLKLYSRVNDELIELESVALCFRGVEDAERFAAFALDCCRVMREMGDDFSHEHYAGGEVPDVTIERLIDTG